LIPGKTSKQQVDNLWGKPFHINFGTYYYQVIPDGRVVIHFADDKVNVVHFDLSNCNLGVVIDIMGPPDALELKTLVPDIMPSANGRRILYVITFHYPSHGFGFEITCSHVLVEEECLKFSPSDAIDQKRFYKRNSNIEDLIGFGDNSKIIQWSGFDE
jgi:hypothetical protein